jgi:hypothetical protein
MRLVSVVLPLIEKKIFLIPTHFKDGVIQIFDPFEADGSVVDMVDFQINDEEIDNPDDNSQEGQDSGFALQIQIRPEAFHGIGPL